MNISKKIQRIRLDKDLSQSELASRINRSRQFIVNVESGKTSPTIADVTEISIALGVEPADLIAEFANLNNTQSKSVVYEGSNFKDVLLYVLSEVGAKPNVGETVLYKLLYFIDFHYYKVCGQSITGAHYIRNHFGPTPVEFKNVIDELIRNKQVIKVNSVYFQYEQRKYMPLTKPDLSKLSAQEKHHIDSVISYYGDKSASELSAISHSEAPWQKTSQGSIINYDLIK